VPSETAVLAHQFDDVEQQHAADAFGMWIFLTTEILIFGGLLVVYVVYRSAYPRDFAAAAGRLNVLIGVINTLVLLTSSLTMVLAVHAARLGRRRPLIIGLVITALLGLIFLGLKAIEYYGDYRERLMPGIAFEPSEWRDAGFDPAHVQLMLLLYYITTLLHGLHLTIGIGILSVLGVLAWRGTFTPESYMPVDIAGLYWHFVDIVWIFLLPLLYLSSTRHLSDLHFW
jgi:cytochrome c oxidase subunit 3